MTLEVELDRPGRHQGALLVPWSRDESAYGQLVVPVTVLNGGPGPTLLLTGGVHGDEYEGQIYSPSSRARWMRLIFAAASSWSRAQIRRLAAPDDARRRWTAATWRGFFRGRKAAG